jgi:microcystin-dependent protein
MGTKDVTLSAVIVPSHVLTFNATNGQITATDALGNAVTSGASIGEGAVIDIMATPDPGYKFVEWTVVSEHGEGGTVENPAVSSTKFTMGTENATLRAIFESTGRNNNNRNSER